MKSFFKEFKNFAIKGNLIDMAVAVVIGTAFNKVVSALVKKVVMPPLSLMTEGGTLTEYKYVLREASEGVEELAIGYGELLEVVIDFFIIAFTVFVVIKFINRFKKKSDDPANEKVETPKNIELLAKIERLLDEQNSILKKEKS